MKKNKNYPVAEYPFVLNYDPEDKVYIAQAIDLKGCHSDGKTPEEAMNHLYEAMEGWIETARKHHIQIPSPSRRASRAKKFPLRIDPENVQKLERLAMARNASMNQIINEAIERF